MLSKSRQGACRACLHDQKKALEKLKHDFFEAWKSFFPLVFALEAKHFVFLKVHLLASLHQDFALLDESRIMTYPRLYTQVHVPLLSCY